MISVGIRWRFRWRSLFGLSFSDYGTEIGQVPIKLTIPELGLLSDSDGHFMRNEQAEKSSPIYN
jgi:hypothetical protein